MKKLILLLVLLPCMLIVKGQKSTKTIKGDGFYIGLNSTNVIKNLLSFSSNSTNDPYTLVGSLNKGNSAFRFGIGVDIATKKNDDLRFADNTNSKFDFRVGYQWTKQLWSNLYFIYGVDILGGWENDFSVIGSISNQDDIWKVGLGPISGVLYRINNRLSISTESSFYFNYSNRTVTLKQPGLPDESARSHIYRFAHILPNALYVYFRI